MSDDAPPRELEIFTAALQLPVVARAAFLEHACGGDGALHQRVEVLLKAHGEAGDFLEQPPEASISPAFSTGFAGEKPGDWIGRYKLLDQIGEGGCGVVYMAEQVEPVRRRVALKIIKPGMDTRSVIARFEAERQALALMDHPNIAKVFDAGATGSGRPYFVMELVRGTKITTYCDEHALPTEDRLKLFIQVCQAVQHAHQKGIIHRDLKPANILVTTAENCAPSPIVIDFGIAKATTNQPLTDKTLFTAFEMLIGTPAYMSPEQAVQGSVDVDTRTDIYSLGVLLYELLTGTTPFDAGELLKAGLDEVRRAIREQDPARPSARLGRMTREQQTTVAQRRKAEPPGLIRVMSGDLDWITMKALEKNRARRYETASGLAADVNRFLINETVAARPPSASYRLRKAVSRHKLLFVVLGSVALLLVASLTAIAASLSKERQARREADADRLKALAEAGKSRQVTQFLEEMLQGVGPSVALGRDTTLLREILDKTAARAEKELADQPATLAELQSRIGDVYLQLALYADSEKMVRSAWAIYQRLYGEQNRVEVAATLKQLGQVLQKQSRYPEAEKSLRDALARQRALFGAEHREVAATLNELSSVLYVEAQYVEA
ncbi:MAG: serine/threonine-protein kinase, partial [Verrucomicrobia bacterium]|nr:serine/threonine-protein kinase [Verrucomicrobiota bacterium]